MRKLVTGAGGYLAEQLILQLSNSGYQVSAMYRGDYNKSIKSENIQWIKGDLMDIDSLRNAVLGCEEVYHVAAFSKSWAKDPRMFYDVNVGGTINLIEAAKEAGVKRIVVTSTAGAIGPANVGKFVTEDQYRRIDFFGDYESSKFIMNEKILDYVRKGMDIRIVCPSRIFGPGNLGSKGSTMTQILRSYLLGKWRIQLGSGTDRANYVYIDDVVQGHLLAMEKGAAGEKYLIGSFNESFSGLMSSLSQISGKKYKLYKIPFGVLGFYANVVGVIAKIFNFDPVITKDWVNKLHQNWQADISKAKDELGYEPTPKEEALRKTIEWINKESK